MRIRNVPIMKIICWFLYYNFAIYLPQSRKCLRIGEKARRFLCKRIFAKCSNTANIERGARFGYGFKIELGKHSGIGINAEIPSNTKIGDNVMMGPNCVILSQNHKFDNTEIPMIKQGYNISPPTIIENDVWIGRNVIMTPGRHIKEGSIIAAGCVLCKDFPAYSIIGGNPSKIIKSRINNNENN